MSKRTWSRASAGHKLASVGTVETTVMLRRISHGPRSMPERTNERGAGTRQAPWRHASHISSQEASKAMESPARTRSSGPRGESWQNNVASASTNAAALRWGTATPFGVPVDPEVKMIQASSWGSGGPVSPRLRVRRRSRPAEVMVAVTSASPKTRAARSSGSSASTGT